MRKRQNEYFLKVSRVHCPERSKLLGEKTLKTVFTRWRDTQSKEIVSEAILHQPPQQIVRGKEEAVVGKYHL